MFVKIKRSNGTDIWVNADTVAYVAPSGANQARIQFVYGTEPGGPSNDVIVSHTPWETVELLRGNG